MEAADLVVTVRAITGQFTEAMAKVDAQLKGATERMAAAGEATAAVGGKITRGLTVPILAVSGEAAKMGMDFQKNMALIQSSAGGSANDVKVLTNQVLDLARKAPQGPNELAKALFHLKSLGLDNVDAMGVLQQAIRGSVAGQADLEAVTNALGGAVRTNITGTKNYAQAMATLNGITGAGNMRMDDLTQALGTGVLPVAKLAGLSLKDVGAAMALMTDENVPAVVSATRLRTAFMLMQAPSKQGEAAMEKLGFTAQKTGEMMRTSEDGFKSLGTTQGVVAEEIKKGGLLGAIQMIADKYDATAKTVGKTQAFADMAKAFGGAKAASTIMMLANNVGVLSQKYDQIGKATKNFDADVAAQQATTLNKLKTAWSSIEVDLIKLGSITAPILAMVVGWLGKLADAFDGLPASVKKGIVIGALVVAALGPILTVVGTVVTAVAGLATVFTAVISPIGLVVGAIALLVGGIAAAEFAPRQLQTALEKLGLSAQTAGRIVGALRGVFSALRGAVESIVGVFTGLSAPVKHAAEVFGEVVAAVAAVAAVGATVIAAFGAVIAVVSAAGSAFGVVAGVIGAVLSPILLVVGGLAVFVAAVAAAVLWPDKLKEALERMGLSATTAGKIVSDLQTVFHELVAAGEFLVGQISAHWAAIRSAVSSAVDAVVGVVRDHWSQVKSTVVSVSEAIVGVVRDNWSTIRAIVAGVIDVIVTLARDGWSTIKSVVGTAIQVIVALAKTELAIFETLWKTFGGTLKTIAQNTWNLIKSVVSGGLEAIKGVVEIVSGLIHGDWQKVWQGIEDLTKGVLKIVVAVVTNAFENLLAVVAKIGQLMLSVLRAAWNQLVGVAQSVWGAITAAVTTAGNAVVGALQKAWGTVESSTKSAWDTVKNGVTTAVDAVETAIRTGLTKAATWVVGEMTTIGSSIVNGLSRIVGEAAAEAAAIGRAILEGIVNGISGLGTALYNKGKGEIEGAISKLKGLLHINSPSLLFRDELGSPMAEGIVAGMTGLGDSLGGSMISQTQDAISAVKGFLGISSPSKKTKTEIGVPMGQGAVLGWLNSTASLGDTMTATVTQALSQAKNAIDNARSSFDTAFGTLASDIDAVFDAQTEKLQANMTTKWDRMGQALTTTSNRNLQALTDSLKSGMTNIDRATTAATNKIQAGLTAQTNKIHSGLTAQTSKINADLKAGTDRIARTLTASKNRISDQLDATKTAIDASLQSQQDAINKAGQALTPTEQKISDLQSTHDEAGRQQAISDAKKQLSDAQAALAGGSGTQDQVTQAQQQLDQANYDEQIALLQKQADAERKARDDLTKQQLDQAQTDSDNAKHEAEEKAKLATQAAEQQATVQKRALEAKAQTEIQAADREAKLQTQAAEQKAKLQEQAIAREAKADKAALSEQVSRAKTALREREAVEAKSLARRSEQQQRNLTAQRELLKRHFDTELGNLQAFLDQHPTKWGEAHAKLMKLLKTYNVDFSSVAGLMGDAYNTMLNEDFTKTKRDLVQVNLDTAKALGDAADIYAHSGKKLGQSFADGLRSKADEVRAAATELAHAAARPLELHSPAKEGPLSRLDSWWSPFASTLLKGLDVSRVSNALGRMVVPGVAPVASLAAAAPTIAQGGGSTSNVFNVENHNHGALLAEADLTNLIRRELVKIARANGNSQGGTA